MDRNLVDEKKFETAFVATHEGGVDRNGSGLCFFSSLLVATHEGGVDRNRIENASRGDSTASPPTRVAWIETYQIHRCQRYAAVATHEGGVDRNNKHPAVSSFCHVATHEGGVDRNVHTMLSSISQGLSPPTRVAWIETMFRLPSATAIKSPPTRVAWIETRIVANDLAVNRVATHEGGVDRNNVPLSAPCAISAVATHEGGVDRNKQCSILKSA